MKIIKSILVIVFLITLNVNVALSYDGETHGDINKNIAEITDANSKDLNSYLKNLGFVDGIKTIFCVELADCTTDVRKWLSLGGEQEDEPMYFRSQNHFHNPLNPWDEAGLDHILFSGQSAIIWSQDQTNGRFVDLGGDWSWTTARKFYYAALTGDSTDLDGFVVEDGLVEKTTITGKTEMNENERSLFFAWTFRALGQVMHLAQDASVPAHTRNDVHVLYNYEKAVKKLRKEEDALYVNAVKNPISFAPFILDDASNSLAPIPIAKIIDTDAYISDNPDITASQAIGLAEYSNANFFSQSTCADSDLFLYPNVSDECTELVTKNIIIDGEEREVQYYKKIACGEDNDGQGYLLALVDALEWWREFLALTGYDINMLDEEVYKDYAKLLIPRAVGYSKGLSDYFFRGDIDLELTSADDGFNLVNNGDELLDGTFSLYYDDADGIRRLVTSFGNMQVHPGDYAPVNFTPPTDYDPKVPNEYMLVFRGKMGEEVDAVAAMQVILQRPYIYFQVRNWASVWDVMASKVATNIKNAQGEPISFPCRFSALYAWRDMTESTGTVLFNATRDGNTFVYNHSFYYLWTTESHTHYDDENCSLGPNGEDNRKDLNSDTEAVFSRDNLFNTKDIATYSRTLTGEYTSVISYDFREYGGECVFTVAELEARGACYIDYDACFPPYACGYGVSTFEHWYAYEIRENQYIEYLRSGYIPTFKITAYNMATPVEEYSRTQGNIAYEFYRYLACDLYYTLQQPYSLDVVEKWETWDITYEADSPWGHIKTFTLKEDSRGGKEVAHLPVYPKIIGQYTDEIIVRAYIWQYQLGTRDASVYQPSTPVGPREFIVNASVARSEDTSLTNPFTSMPRHTSFEEALRAVIIADWNDTGLTSNPSVQIRW